MFRFGALGAKGMKHLARFRAKYQPLGWPVGSLTRFAVVVDLPLATAVIQNVFGTSETPVFISWTRIGGFRFLILFSFPNLNPNPYLNPGGGARAFREAPIRRRIRITIRD